MDVKFTANDKVTAEEMQLLAESVGFGRDRSLERNEIALAGSILVASARCNDKLIGLLRFIGSHRNF